MLLFYSLPNVLKLPEGTVQFQLFDKGKFNYVEPANIKGDLSKQETCTIEKIKSYPDSRDVLLQK